MPESVTFAGIPSRVPMARHIVATLLTGSPRVDDAALIVSELVGNAVRHSLSRGGVFTLAIDMQPGWARLEVADDGPLPPDQRQQGEPGEFGRGLMLVRAYADRWGHERGPVGQTYWAELGWEEQ